MKMGYVALAIIILISALLASFMGFLSRTTDELKELISLTDTFVENGEFQQAFLYFKKAKENWEKWEKIYELQIENEELDNISGIFSEIEAYFEKNFFEDYFEASYRLKFYIDHIRTKNKASLETVL